MSRPIRNVGAVGLHKKVSEQESARFYRRLNPFWVVKAVGLLRVELGQAGPGILEWHGVVTQQVGVANICPI